MKESDAFEGGSLCEYQENAYVWEIEVPQYKPCRPDKITGKLGLYEVSEEKIAFLEKGDNFYNYPPPQGEVRITNRCVILENTKIVADLLNNKRTALNEETH